MPRKSAFEMLKGVKELCDFYVSKDLINGCGKPFKIILNPNSKDNDDKFIAIICDYI